MKNVILINHAKMTQLAEDDEEFLAIMADFRQSEKAYLELYRQLIPEQQEILTELIGRLSELHLRQLELLMDL